MNLKTLAVILAVLLGGMAIYYNQSVSTNSNANANGEASPKAEKSK